MGVFTLTFIAEEFCWFWGVRKKYRFIAICCLSVWRAAFTAWWAFKIHWGVVRRCDPSWCCKSIWCAQTHCLVPVDTLPRHEIDTQSAAFWAATCVSQRRHYHGGSGMGLGVHYGTWTNSTCHPGGQFEYQGDGKVGHFTRSGSNWSYLGWNGPPSATAP